MSYVEFRNRKGLTKITTIKMDLLPPIGTEVNIIGQTYYIREYQLYINSDLESVLFCIVESSLLNLE
jgi:hypothetical protein